MRQLKPCSARKASHHPLIWATIFHTFFSLIHPVDEFFFKEMRMWSQPKTSYCFLCVWCKSKELGGRGEYKTPNINDGKLLRRFSSSYGKLLDRVTFRILSNINNGATLRKYVERLQMIALIMVILMVFYNYGELVPRRVDPILGNGQKQPSEVFF